MTHQTANFGNLIYDSTNQNLIKTGQQRIGTSATEIELLDDVPLSSGTSSKSQFLNRPMSTGTNRDQQPISATSTLPKEPSRIIYANPSDEALGSAVDRLLERYAPDALPSNMYNTSTTRRPLTQQDTVTTNTETLRSTYQTTSSAPPPPAAPAPAPVPPSTTASHNYSTIIRPNRGANVQTPENYPSQPIRPTATKNRPITNYDSFQHVAPQVQQINPIPMQLKNGNVPPIVPGQLYSLDDDPLDLIYDRQAPSQIPPPRPPPLSKQAKAAMPSTFQPTTTRPTNYQDPLTAIFPDLAQATTTTTTTTMSTTIPAPAPALPAFDLGNLIKQVQQDYLHEIQPFVSSVKFIDKDHELGQNLADVNFSTPVTVRKGFLDKADDLLRRSFGRQDHSRRFPEKKKEESNEMYSDEDDDKIQDLPSKNRYSQLQKLNSKASTISSATTITSSVFTDEEEDDDDDDVSEDSRPAHVVDQSTSPPPKEEPIKSSSGLATKTSPTNDKAKQDIRPIVPTLARRIPSDEQSDSTLESDEEEDDDDDDHETAKPTPKPLEKPTTSIAAVATTAPIVKPNEDIIRRQAEEARRATERSDDIHPIPPTIKSDVPTEKPPEYQRRPIPETESENDSGSEGVSDSDEETPVKNSRNPPSASTTAPAPATTTNSRFPAPTTTTTAMPTRGTELTTASTTNSRFPAASTTTPSTPIRGTESVAPTTANSRLPPAATTTTPSRGTDSTGAAATNSRLPAATTSTSAGTMNSNVRGEPSGNPNLPFVSPDRRIPNSTPASGQPSATPQTPSQSQAKAGSARLFAGSTDTKASRTGGSGAGTRGSSFRDRLKGIKSRLFGK